MPASYPLKQTFSKNVEEERELGKQGLLGEAGRPRSQRQVGMKDVGSGSLWSEAGLGPSDGSRVAPT